MPADYVPPLLQKARDTAGIDDKTGQYLPKDIELIESTGRRTTLGEYFDGKRPLIIQLAYYRCPKLCGEITKGMVDSMAALAQELRLGEDYQILTISFDSREPATLAASNKEAVVDVLGRSVSADAVQRGWSFFVGEDEHLKPLTQAMGYRFGWLAEVEQYSHPAAIVICTPDGKISRYLYGASYDTQAMRLSLINASQGTITPSLKDQFILTCFEFDPKIGKYTPVAMRLMQAAGIVTVLVLAGLITFMVIAEKRGRFLRHRYRGTPAEPDGQGRDSSSPPPRTAFS
jgi:protein SCO1/2